MNDIAEQKGRLGNVVHLDTVANVTEAELLDFAATFFDVEGTNSTLGRPSAEEISGG